MDEATSVLDIPVVMQLLFQQFYQFEFLKVPQIRFRDRVLDIPVLPQRQVCTVPAAQKTGDSTAQFLEEVCRARCCATPGAWCARQC